MLDWNGLRVALAIARAGGLAPAAQQLGVNHSTVFRRLNALEQQLGAQLFERLPGGYQPTAAGARLVGVAERIEAEALSLERELTGQDARLSGRLRVTSSETLAYSGAHRRDRRLSQAPSRHPARAADRQPAARPVAARGGSRVARHASARGRPVRAQARRHRLGGLRLAAYLAERCPPAGLHRLGEHALIAWDVPAATVKTAAWLAASVPESAIVYRSSSLINQLIAARAGIGLAVLPCYLAIPKPGLQRALPPIPELTRELWLITHKALKGTARVRTFMELVGEGVRLRLRQLERPVAGAGPAAVAAGGV